MMKNVKKYFSIHHKQLAKVSNNSYCYRTFVISHFVNIDKYLSAHNTRNFFIMLLQFLFLTPKSFQFIQTKETSDEFINSIFAY